MALALAFPATMLSRKGTRNKATTWPGSGGITALGIAHRPLLATTSQFFFGFAADICPNRLHLGQDVHSIYSRFLLSRGRRAIPVRLIDSTFAFWDLAAATDAETLLAQQPCRLVSGGRLPDPHRSGDHQHRHWSRHGSISGDLGFPGGPRGGVLV
jgi:hypothetical protein